jgi:hypothetical protein
LVFKKSLHATRLLAVARDLLIAVSMPCLMWQHLNDEKTYPIRELQILVWIDGGFGVRERKNNSVTI